MKQMLNFYLAKPSIIDAECSPELNSVLSRADSQIPDDRLGAPGQNKLTECRTCADGSECGESNATGRTCRCVDIDRDSMGEFCFLKPVIPPIKTCNTCKDGTHCAAQNSLSQLCRCKDTDSDGSNEYCYLASGAGKSDICVNCRTPGSMNCNFVCQGGSNSVGGSRAITSCRYDGQTIYITRGSNSQQSSCINSHC